MKVNTRVYVLLEKFVLLLLFTTCIYNNITS